jgi:hypothetical protein
MRSLHCVTLCYLYKYCAAREIVCACYGELTAGLDSRLPASCRGNSGEADDAEPEDLDSGPQVLLNLLWIVGSLGWCVAFLVYFFVGLGCGGCCCLSKSIDVTLHIFVQYFFI